MTIECAVTESLRDEQRVEIVSPRFDRNLASPPETLTAEHAAQLADFRTLIETGQLRMIQYSCPCGATGACTKVATIDRYGLPLDTVVCETCGTLRFDPYLDGPSVEKFYTEHYQGLYRRSLDLPAYFLRQTAYGEKVLRHLNFPSIPNRRVLEIGCGAGGALSVFAKAGWDCVGCEYDERLVAYAQSTGLVGVRKEPLVKTVERLGPHSCDLVFSHHVFEHVCDPEDQLRTAVALLKPGGVLLHVVPDILGIDQSDFPAGDSLQYFHVAHVYNYTLHGLDLLARRGGRRARRMTPPIQSTPWSHASEMWVEFPETLPADSVAGAEHNGELVRGFLKRTEFKYRNGLCLPQWRNRLRHWKQALWNLPKLARHAFRFSRQ
jgi:SAM-dependent methyltransferase